MRTFTLSLQPHNGPGVDFVFCLLHAYLLVLFFFNLEDGGCMFLRNFSYVQNTEILSDGSFGLRRDRSSLQGWLSSTVDHVTCARTLQRSLTAHFDD
jgi:hypothetical protein